MVMQEEIIQDIETQHRKAINGIVELGTGAGLAILAVPLMTSDLDLSSQIVEYVARYGTFAASLSLVGDGLRRARDGATQLYHYAKQRNSE